MRDWHVKHMQDTIVKYLTGLSENATRWQKKLDKKYGNLTQVTKRIDYDLKHGVERHDTNCLHLTMRHTTNMHCKSRALRRDNFL